jgi:iduronate 2-sulfatase
MWQYKNAGYYSARVSKIFHMGVPGGIENGGDGADDPASWSERFNSQGPEWQAPGIGETLENNADGKKPVMGGNTFVIVAADGDEMVHSDGKTSAKAGELIAKHAQGPFFLAVGFVRPHVPFVAPKKYFDLYPWEQMRLPEKLPGDWDDIPKPGINYKTSVTPSPTSSRAIRSPQAQATIGTSVPQAAAGGCSATSGPPPTPG